MIFTSTLIKNDEPWLRVPSEFYGCAAILMMDLFRDMIALRASSPLIRRTSCGLCTISTPLPNSPAPGLKIPGAARSHEVNVMVNVWSQIKSRAIIIIMVSLKFMSLCPHNLNSIATDRGTDTDSASDGTSIPILFNATAIVLPCWNL